MMKETGRRRIDTALGVVGRTFITAGLLLLGLVVYQLWGTGIEQRRAQDRLREDFTELISTVTATPSTATDSSATTAAGSTDITVPKRPNSALALLEVPSAGIADIVVEGATVSALRHGPGHITGTALPGEAGNSAIAGHRTTYGAPFANLDDVAIGDEVKVTTARGVFTYAIDDVRIVGPNRTDVLRPRGKETIITLITCHPRFSTAKRLIVTAELTSSAPLSSTTPSTVPETSTTTPSAVSTTVPTTEVGSEAAAVDIAELDGWFSDTGAVLPSILLGIALVAISLAAHFGRRKLRAHGRSGRASLAISWSAAAVPFLVTLFYWYHFINMLLPAST